MTLTLITFQHVSVIDTVNDRESSQKSSTFIEKSLGK
ncbi:unnamed protein product, partial [Rotaria magnacalcarata]